LSPQANKKGLSTSRAISWIGKQDKQPLSITVRKNYLYEQFSLLIATIF